MQFHFFAVIKFQRAYEKRGTEGATVRNLYFNQGRNVALPDMTEIRFE